MTACSSKLQHLSYKTEAAWGENSTSMTSAQTIPITAMVDASKLGRSMLESGRVVQYRNDVPKKIPGMFENSEFTLEIELVGHGSTTAGSVTASAFENLLAWVFGAINTPATGTTISGTSSTAVSLNVAAASGFAAGDMIRAGAKRDGRGDGQWADVASHGTSVIALKTALPAAMTTAADVIYSATVVYTPESTCVVSPRRFVLKTADLSWCLHGCFPKAAKLAGGGVGQTLKLQITVGVSWGEPISTTFPDTTTTAAWTTLPTPIAAGSIFMQDFGTTTRQVLAARQFSIDLTLGIVPLFGYTGVSEAQGIVGASRVADTVNVSITVDAEGDDATPTWWDKWAANTEQHLLAGYTVGDGSAIACYLPRLVWTGAQPTQVDGDGLNRVTLSLQARTDPSETTDQARSMMRWGFA
jgi:hypothetical protein